MKKILLGIISISLLASCSSVKTKRSTASAKEDALLNCQSQKWVATYNMRIVDRLKRMDSGKVDPKLLEEAKKLKRNLANNEPLMKETYTSPFQVRFEFEKSEDGVTGAMYLGLKKIQAPLTCDSFAVNSIVAGMSGDNVVMKDNVETGCTFDMRLFIQDILVNTFHISGNIIPASQTMGSDGSAGFVIKSEHDPIINSYFFDPIPGGDETDYKQVGLMVDFLEDKLLTCKQ